MKKITVTGLLSGMALVHALALPDKSDCCVCPGGVYF